MVGLETFEHSLALPFFATGMKTDLFQSCGHCWFFQICWHIECSPFTASSFRIWNSSTGIPSPPVVLFIVMLPKAHLTSDSRMSGSRWVITPSWLSGSWRSFFVLFFCVFLPPLLIFHQTVSRLTAANHIFLRSWRMVDICQEGHSLRSALQRRDMAHLKCCSWGAPE